MESDKRWFVSTVALLLVAVVLYSLGPLLLIWSLRTLLSLEIEYSLKNWVAALALMACVRGGTSSKR